MKTTATKIVGFEGTADMVETAVAAEPVGDRITAEIETRDMEIAAE